MSLALSGLFASGLSVTGFRHILLMLPLCLSIAVVYKTLRCAHVRQIVPAALALWATIVAAMGAVGLGLWTLYLLTV